MKPLLATYRLQLHRGFRFAAARRIVPYLRALGVSHVYLSPVFRARRGSTHGYDVTDPTAVNPDLGSEADFRRLIRELRRQGMGAVLDVVPNHMAASAANPYWEDVLARGPASRYAPWFDIDWGHGPRPARLLLPVLGAPLEQVLAQGDLRVTVERGRPRLRYHEHSFPLSRTGEPIRPAAYAGRAGAARLRALLERQPYELAYWRDGARRLNYRRFFTISDLVGVRVGDAAVFAATHALVARWTAAGLVDGLRIDHIDGLRDPRRYLLRLKRLTRRTAIPILVEKILARDERLRPEWPVAGTTGYEFLNEVEDLFIDRAATAEIERAYRRVTGRRASFAETALAGKRKLLRLHFVAEIGRLVGALTEALAAGRAAPRRPRAALATAIRELVAHVPVYRTYLDDRRGAPVAADRRILASALRDARAAGRADAGALGVVRQVLWHPRRSPAHLAFAERFQQLCAAVAAKGVEDTAFYVHVPLVSRNEVGGAPDAPLADARAVLHAANRERARRWPQTLLGVSTHDTKRGADTRARIDVLSERPAAWIGAVRRWRGWNRPFRTRHRGGSVPDANTEYLFYQNLVAIWPVEPAPRSVAGLTERVAQYMHKAAREAKQRTSWIAPDEAFERALETFVRRTLTDSGGARFRADVAEFVRGIARPALWNGLARTVIQLTAPGVPDIYQGDELWELTLVDPDNRRAVDFARRRRLLARLQRAYVAGGARREQLLADLVAHPEDGGIALHVIRLGLEARRRWPGVFVGGAYRPLGVRGSGAAHVFAFARQAGARWAVTIVPLRALTLAGDPGHAPIGDVWDDTHVLLPASLRGRCRSAFTGESVPIDPAGRGARSVAVRKALARFPVALLLGGGT